MSVRNSSVGLLFVGFDVNLALLVICAKSKALDEGALRRIVGLTVIKDVVLKVRGAPGPRNMHPVTHVAVGVEVRR